MSVDYCAVLLPGLSVSVCVALLSGNIQHTFVLLQYTAKQNCLMIKVQSRACTASTLTVLQMQTQAVRIMSWIRYDILQFEVSAMCWWAITRVQYQCVYCCNALLSGNIQHTFVLLQYTVLAKYCTVSHIVWLERCMSESGPKSAGSVTCIAYIVL